VDSGFYASCAGLRAQSQALEVAAHNLANLSTNGFRSQQPSFQSLLAATHPVPNVLNLAINNYGVLEGTHLDRSAGNLQATGNPLDLGIEGVGFFAIQTQQGTRYTRNGSFRVARTGQLATAAGDPVLGENGTPIPVPAGSVSVSSDGTISVNSAIAGKLRLVEFPPDTRLVSEGDLLLRAPDGAAQAAKQTTVRQGTLESSNVNPIAAVMTVIGVQRNAEMMQRALSMFFSEFNRIAANDVPRV